MTEQPQPQIPPVAYQPAPMLEADARMWAMLINLATVAGIVLSGGLLGIVAVFVIWLVYRERSALIDFHGKQQLNLNITAVLATIAFVIVSVMTLGIGAVVLGLPFLAYGIYLFVVSIVAAVAANRGEYYRIALVFRFIT